VRPVSLDRHASEIAIFRSTLNRVQSELSKKKLSAKENEMTDIKIQEKEEADTCCGGSGQCGCKNEEKADVKTEGSCCGGTGCC